MSEETASDILARIQANVNQSVANIREVTRLLFGGPLYEPDDCDLHDDGEPTRAPEDFIREKQESEMS